MKVNPSQHIAKINSGDMVEVLMGEIDILLYPRLSQVKIHLPSRLAQYILYVRECALASRPLACSLFGVVRALLISSDIF